MKSAGAKQVIALPDNLAVGPSSRSLKLHPKIRERYWRLEYTTARWGGRFSNDGDELVELLGADAVAARVTANRAGAIYLWSSGLWNDILFLGWLFDAVTRRGNEWRNVALAGDLRSTMPLGWLNPEQLYPYGRSAAPVTDAVRRGVTEVWRAFTEHTPGHLERLRADPPRSLPTLMSGLAVYAAMLPRRLSGARRVLLPVVDEALFRIIPTRRHVRFPDLFKGSSATRARWPKAGLLSMLSYFGEAFMLTRIAGWCIGRDPAIEQIALPAGTDGPYTTSWRLTERGQRLLGKGLDTPEDCPDQTIGGYRSGRGGDWCCAVRTGGWRLERCR